MVSTRSQIKLAIVITTIVNKKLPLDVIAEKLRDWFGLDLTERQIAATFSRWRKMGIPIHKERFDYSEEGYTRARAIYSISRPKTIKRLLDTLYKQEFGYDK